jgi:hypothetical protein
MSASRHASAIALAIASSLSSPTASADSISKDQCVDAHSRGQDAREQGKLSLARKLFLSCAQASCPALVQSDCARFADDLGRLQPSLTFVARDALGADLPDTAVYVDDNLVVTRLDDGKPHDVDPGRHTVRFSSDGKDQTVTLVVDTGEKGRAVIATFTAVNAPIPSAGAHAAAGLAATSREPEVRTIHPSRSRILIGVGAAVTLTGGVLGVLGVRNVPSNCSISSNRCSAPPGDPVFDQARSGMRLADVGIAVGAVGVAALTGGLAWYYLKATTERTSDGNVVMPLVTRDGAGLAVSGSF